MYAGLPFDSYVVLDRRYLVSMHGSSVQGTTKRRERERETSLSPPPPSFFHVRVPGIFVYFVTDKTTPPPHPSPPSPTPPPAAQATKALTKEAKRVRTFLLQQAIRKSKAAALKGKRTKTNDSGDGDGGGDGDVCGSGDSASPTLEQSQQDSARSEVVDEKNATKTATETAAAATAGGVAGAGEDKQACFDRDPAGGAAKGERGTSSSSSPASEEVLLIKVMSARSFW